MGEVDIVESINLRKSDYTVVLGLAGAGFIANTSTMYIARVKGWKQVAYVRSRHVPPMILLVDGQAYQSFRIYVDDDGKTLVAVTENLIQAEDCYPLASALVNWFKEKGAKEIVSVDGMPFSGVGDSIALTFASNYDAGKLGYPAAKEGAVSGLNAAILDECINRKIPWLSLFIPTRQLTTIDYGGAADAIEVLNKMYKYGVDPTPLRKSDEAIRKAISQQQQKAGIGKVFGRK